jgi:DNA-binding NtrC family response regulator
MLKPRLLIIDSSCRGPTSLEPLLQETEFVVDAAHGVARALDAIASVDYAAIIVDVPEGEARLVCQRLGAEPRSADVPVLLVVCQAPEPRSASATGTPGLVDYAIKPFGREELLMRIELLRDASARLRASRRDAEAARARADQACRAAERLRAEVEDQATVIAELDRRGGLMVIDRHGELVRACPRARELLSGWDLVEPGAGARRGFGTILPWLAALDPAGGEARHVVAGLDGEPIELRARNLGGGDWLVEATPAAVLEAARLRIAGRAAASAERPSVGAALRRLGYRIPDFIGEAEVLDDLTTAVDRLRRGRANVLIRGETGVGKEIVARALHFDGPFAERPFIPIHCGAISSELIESELFGHEKGAFTGAVHAKVGLFEAADGGTVFLDEIAETSRDLQVKLLRVLQSGEIRPVGATTRRHVDIRIIAATNRDLRHLVQQGTFREDLLYRLEVVTLVVPPLRDRRGDIPLLVERFIRTFNEEYGRLDDPVEGVSRAAMHALTAFPWPGNTRELENVIERAFALGAAELLDVEDLPEHVVAGRSAVGASGPEPLRRLHEARTVQQRTEILRAIAAAGGDKSAAARALGVSRSTLYRRICHLGLD